MNVNFPTPSATSQGLGKNHIFTHHGAHYMRNNISLYDQQFNRHYAVGPRKWDRHRLAWLPEASDHPMDGEQLPIHQSSFSILMWIAFLVSGKSTNFGLKEELEERRRRRQALESHGDFDTTHALVFK